MDSLGKCINTQLLPRETPYLVDFPVLLYLSMIPRPLHSRKVPFIPVLSLKFFAKYLVFPSSLLTKNTFDFYGLFAYGCQGCFCRLFYNGIGWSSAVSL